MSAAAAEGGWPLGGIQSGPQSKGRTTRSCVTEARWRSHVWENAASIVLMVYCATHDVRLRHAKAPEEDEAGQVHPQCRRRCARTLRLRFNRAIASRHGS